MRSARCPSSAVQRAEDRQGKRCVGEGVLAAADDVHALTDPVGIALRQPADQRRQPRRAGVGLVDKAAEPALQARGVGGLQEGLGAVALQAQSLQGLPLAVEGLVDWDDVVRLGRGGFDGRAAQRAEPLLLQQQLPHVASRRP